MKLVEFSETIAASDLKGGRLRQLIEFMKVYQYARSRSFTYENLNLLFSETTGPFLKKMSYVSF